MTAAVQDALAEMAGADLAVAVESVSDASGLIGCEIDAV